MNEVADAIFHAYSPYLGDNEIDFSLIGNRHHRIPHFIESDLIDLCNQSIEIFKTEPRILQINKPTYVLGDLHGNIVDLLRLLNNIRPEPDHCILFLGDYVDRGDYSIEVVTLLFALKVIHPDSVFLIRGNHEFRRENSVYGFKESLLKEYSEELYESINNTFDYLPLCAIIMDRVFCVHGGISPLLSSLSTIEDIPSPLKSYDDTQHSKLLTDLLWSDPSETTNTYIDSKRGFGCVYGAAAIHQFLFINGFRAMLRAHQCVAAGVMPFANRKLYTVFSSSCYASDYDNHCGFVEVLPGGLIEPYNLEPVRSPPRNFAHFQTFSKDVQYIPHAISAFARQYESRQWKRSKTQAIRLVNPSKVLQKTGSGDVIPRHRPLMIPSSLLPNKQFQYNFR